MALQENEKLLTTVNAAATVQQIKADIATKITEAEVEAKGYLTAVPEEYVTEEELLAKGYITADQIPPEADLPVATADEILALYTGVNTGETV